MTLSKDAQINRLWLELLECDDGPSADMLREVVIRFPEVRAKAWEQLVRLHPSNQILVDVMCRVPSLSLRAGRILLDNKPSIAQLEVVAKNIPALRESADAQLTKLKTSQKRRAADVLSEMRNL